MGSALLPDLKALHWVLMSNVSFHHFSFMCLYIAYSQMDAFNQNCHTIDLGPGNIPANIHIETVGGKWG